MKRERSAGGVVLRDAGRDAHVALISPREGVYALPKGHPGQGETLEQAAIREVREETGLVADLIEKLGDVRYWYWFAGDRVLKTVAFYLFRYRSGSVDDHDDEVVWAGWVPLDEAPDRLTYDGEREMATKALERSAAA